MGLEFRRIVSSGKFIPEIDGLRFIAILSVVLFHIGGFLREKVKHSYSEVYDFTFINGIIEKGHIGVPLFFVISGFILAKPFFSMHQQGGKEIGLGGYFIRRLTRLEPPYILVMTLLFLAMAFVLSNMPIVEAVKSYLASLTYTHNFFYGRDVLPRLNAVAWSLEIEIQFYILTPILTKVFLIDSPTIRRSVVAGLSVISVFVAQLELLPFLSLVDYLHYFLIGFLLVDFYLIKRVDTNPSTARMLGATLLFLLIWILEVEEHSNLLLAGLYETMQLLCIFGFYYLVLLHKEVKLLTNPLITAIGGMCYTIYLIHYPIVSLFGNKITAWQISTNQIVDLSLYTMLLLAVIMLCSSVFYLMVERPCMDKNWYKRLSWKKNTNAKT